MHISSVPHFASRIAPYSIPFKNMQSFLKGSRTHFDVESCGRGTKACPARRLARGTAGGSKQRPGFSFERDAVHEHPKNSPVKFNIVIAAIK